MSGSVEAALRALGVRCTVERRGTLAVLTTAPGDRAFERSEVRRQALAMLRAYGFTHAAVESADDDPCAPRAGSAV
ncbi:MAG: hypothetical protein ABR499_18405 [Gemmatimonadaceae bacterium]